MMPGYFAGFFILIYLVFLGIGAYLLYLIIKALNLIIKALSIYIRKNS